MQGEDEIASIGFCLGAAAGGATVMTATSGPGISLFSEQISFAIGAEIPIVIIDVQRLGPSTGSATKGADGDIQFLRWGNSGGLPVIVLSPVDVIDCFNLTKRAFELAYTFRCPVFIASNKEVGMTRESVDLQLLSGDSKESVTQLKGVTEVTPFVQMGGKQLVRFTSSTHGSDNYITSDPQVILESVSSMDKKLSLASGDLACYELDEGKQDTVLLVAYGVTARAAREAIVTLRADAHCVSLLVLKTLYPVSEQCIKRAGSGKEKIVVVEMNLGQYVREIERLVETTPVMFLGQMNGELITPDTIIREVLK